MRNKQFTDTMGIVQSLTNYDAEMMEKIFTYESAQKAEYLKEGQNVT